MARIFIGGKERELKLGTYAMGEIEKDIGCNFLSGGSAFFKDLQVGKVVCLIWGGLLWKEQSLSKAVVAGWIDELAEKGELEGVLGVIQAMIEECPFFAPTKEGTEKKIDGKKSKPSA